MIRDAHVNDVSALARVHLSAWQEAYRGVCADAYLDSLTVETFEGYHRPRFREDGRAQPAQPFIVACNDNDKLVGFARGGPTRAASPTGDALPEGFASQFDCELYAIYVDPPQQSRGVGRALFGELVHRFIALGHRTMCLWVLTDNTGARKFYQRLGGEVVAESSITLDGTPYPQVAYAWKELLAHAEPGPH